MDYSKLSDFEINKLVAKSFGYVDVRQLKNMINEIYCEINGIRSFKDFCNNPSDAWPIIVENEIGVNKLKCEPYWLSSDNKGTYARDKNPLRAAMIVYLMMNEDK